MMTNTIAFAIEHDFRVVCPALHKFSADFDNLRDNVAGAFPAPDQPGLLMRLPGSSDFFKATRLLQHLGTGIIELKRYAPVTLPGMILVDDRQFKQRGLGWNENAMRAIIGTTSIAFQTSWKFRCPDLVRRHAPAIRSYFSLSQAMRQDAEARVGRLKDGADLVIGTHIRGRDYWNFRSGRYFFPLNQYLEWMRQLSEALRPSSVAFVVCSDEDLSGRDFPHLTVEMGPGNPVGDLAALASCDRIIGPASTFNQWASFFGDSPLCTLDPHTDLPWEDRFDVSDLHRIP